MTTLHLVRHGRASAGWNVDPDPSLDDLGIEQAERAAAALAGLGSLPILCSPLTRCRQTAAPLAALTDQAPLVVEAVGEIPSPVGVDMADRVDWLRAAMAGTWPELGERYLSFRRGIGDFLVGCQTDSVIFSHFVAINAAIGLASGDDRVLIRSLDNCSITTIEVVAGRLVLVAAGHEADTLIR
jgi:broad specificity phosphatase PhoE